jgi:PAS domain S-box-containing protein
METRASKHRSSPDARRLEGIVAAAFDAIIAVNDAQEVVLFNPGAERMFGLAAAEAIGQDLSRFIPDRFRATHADHVRQFTQTGAFNRRMGLLGAASGLRANGEEFHVEASMSQATVGGERLATVILRDITEREVAVAALLDARRRMEGIVASAMDALIAVDDDQRIMLFNPAAERMFGVAAAHAVGSNIERFIPERFRAGHAEHIRRFKQTGVTSRRTGALGAISGLRANGEEFPLEASISQVTVSGVTIATVILRDIAERTASEAALRLLAAEIDHRAKNALAVVQSLISLTRASTKEEFIAAVRDRVAALARAHSLLAQNRWEGGDLKQIITDETGAYGHPDQIHISGPNVFLCADAVQPVSMLVHELATNAVKYGALSTTAGRVNIDLRLLPGSELELSWIETGGPDVPGPPRKGFGSALVNGVATHQLGGSIRVEWPAEGVWLILTLPSSAHSTGLGGARQAAIAPEPALRPSPARSRVLVVEDDMLLALELSEGLAELGYEIVGPAASIEEAIRILDQITLPDAAVLDVNLRGGLVYPLADRLESQGVPFIFCTGYEHLDPHYRHWPSVRKPVNLHQLTDQLNRLRPAA